MIYKRILFFIFIFFFVSYLNLYQGNLSTQISLQDLAIDLNDDDLVQTLTKLFLVIIVFVLVWVCHVIPQIKKQKIWNQPSYIWLLFWGLTLAWVITLFHYHIKFEFDVGFASICVLTLSVFLICSFRVKAKIENHDSFAAGSVGINSDKLEYKNAAKNVADQIVKDPKYFSALALYGEAGEGKSSYVRMLIEHLRAQDSEIFNGKKDLLYTYISLTETNEARGFSHLFSLRWAKTLKKRYPILHIEPLTQMLSVIFRENGMGTLGDLCSILAHHNHGLWKTKVGNNCWDTTLEDQPTHVSREVAAMFAHIPQVQEKIWVVVVDEIERSPFDEIYRLIEAVERFKGEGRTGLPLKVVFVLCVAKQTLDAYIKQHMHSDPKVFLVDKFFSESKSLDYTLFLPVVSLANKKQFFIEKMKHILDLHKIKSDFVVNASFDYKVRYPDQFLKKTEDAMNHIMTFLVRQPLRVLSRCCDELEWVLSSYKHITKKNLTDEIALADLTTLSYIRVQFPYLLDFFKETLNYVLVENNSAYRQMNMVGKKTVPQWINEVTDQSIPISSKQETGVLKGEYSDEEALVAMVARYVVDYLSEPGFKDSDRRNYKNRSSDPRIMKQYLSLFSSDFQDEFKINADRFSKHHAGGLDLTVLESAELDSYIWFIINTERPAPNYYLDLLKEIVRRFTSIDPSVLPIALNRGDASSWRQELIVCLVGCIEALYENSKDNTAVLNDTFEQVQKLLQDDAVPSSDKLQLVSRLSGFYKGYDVIQRAIEKAQQKDKYRELFLHVMNEVDQRYLSGKKVIYRHEEWPEYIFARKWSGDPKAIEVKHIRRAAWKDLEQFPKQISNYWKYYFNLFENRSVDNKLKMYMPVKTLIRKTKKCPDADDFSKTTMSKVEEALKSEDKTRLTDISSERDTLYAHLKSTYRI